MLYTYKNFPYKHWQLKDNKTTVIVVLHLNTLRVNDLNLYKHVELAQLIAPWHG